MPCFGQRAMLFLLSCRQKRVCKKTRAKSCIYHRREAPFAAKFSATQKAPPWVCQFVVLGSFDELGIFVGGRSSYVSLGNKRATRMEERMTIGLGGDGPALGAEIGRENGHQQQCYLPPTTKDFVGWIYLHTYLNLGKHQGTIFPEICPLNWYFP